MVKLPETAISCMSQENIPGHAMAELSKEKEKRNTQFTDSDKFPKQYYMDYASKIQCIA